MVLSIITDGCSLDWDPAKRPVAPVLLMNLPSTRAEEAFVSEANLAGGGRIWQGRAGLAGSRGRSGRGAPKRGDP